MYKNNKQTKKKKLLPKCLSRKPSGAYIKASLKKRKFRKCVCFLVTIQIFNIRTPKCLSYNT